MAQVEYVPPPPHAHGYGAAATVTVENLRVVAPSALAEPPREDAPSTAAMVLSAVGAAAGAYHFARRHRGSVPWGLAGGVLGALFPIVVPAVALAQGFGKPLPARTRRNDDKEHDE
jgi:hypothetical protein